VVLWADPPVDLVPDPGEVESAFVVGLNQLDRPDSPRFVSIAESDKPVIQLPIHNRLIHAPTAAILHQFRVVGLHGRTFMTDSVEEPVWAWR
jgi:hypothetical protein